MQFLYYVLQLTVFLILVARTIATCTVTRSQEFRQAMLITKAQSCAQVL